MPEGKAVRSILSSSVVMLFCSFASPSATSRAPLGLLLISKSYFPSSLPIGKYTTNANRRCGSCCYPPLLSLPTPERPGRWARGMPRSVPASPAKIGDGPNNPCPCRSRSSRASPQEMPQKPAERASHAAISLADCSLEGPGIEGFARRIPPPPGCGRSGRQSGR